MMIWGLISLFPTPSSVLPFTLTSHLWIAERLSAGSFSHWIINSKSGAQQMKLKSYLYENLICIQLCSLGVCLLSNHTILWSINWIEIELWRIFCLWSFDFGHWILNMEADAQHIRVELYHCVNPVLVVLWGLQSLFLNPC